MMQYKINFETMTIKKGDRFKCIKSYGKGWLEGDVYESFSDNTLRNCYGRDVSLCWSEQYFEKLVEASSQKLAEPPSQWTVNSTYDEDMSRGELHRYHVTKEKVEPNVNYVHVEDPSYKQPQATITTSTSAYFPTAQKIGDKWINVDPQEDKRVLDTHAFEQTIFENPKIRETFHNLHDLLQYKNKRYGSSGLEPINVFAKTNAETGLLQRIDDKIARIQNSTELRKNDTADLVGYLILLCVSKGWTTFDEFKD